MLVKFSDTPHILTFSRQQLVDARIVPAPEAQYCQMFESVIQRAATCYTNNSLKIGLWEFRLKHNG